MPCIAKDLKRQGFLTAAKSIFKCQQFQQRVPLLSLYVGRAEGFLICWGKRKGPFVLKCEEKNEIKKTHSPFEQSKGKPCLGSAQRPRKQAAFALIPRTCGFAF